MLFTGLHVCGLHLILTILLSIHTLYNRCNQIMKLISVCAIQTRLISFKHLTSGPSILLRNVYVTCSAVAQVSILNVIEIFHTNVYFALFVNTPPHLNMHSLVWFYVWEYICMHVYIECINLMVHIRYMYVRLDQFIMKSPFILKSFVVFFFLFGKKTKKFEEASVILCKISIKLI